MALLQHQRQRCNNERACVFEMRSVLFRFSMNSCCICLENQLAVKVLLICGCKLLYSSAVLLVKANVTVLLQKCSFVEKCLKAPFVGLKKKIEKKKL